MTSLTKIKTMHYIRRLSRTNRTCSKFRTLTFSGALPDEIKSCRSLRKTEGEDRFIKVKNNKILQVNNLEKREARSSHSLHRNSKICSPLWSIKTIRFQNTSESKKNQSKPKTHTKDNPPHNKEHPLSIHLTNKRNHSFFKTLKREETNTEIWT